jgi:hypothetical protein
MPASYIAVKAFFAPPEDPAGMTFNTLNLTVLDNGLQYREQKYINNDSAVTFDYCQRKLIGLDGEE